MTEDIREIFRREILENDDEVRKQYLQLFQDEVEVFLDRLLTAHKSWQKYEATLETNERKALVSAYLFNALNNLAISMKLFISGYAIPSGNLVRQTIESLCIAILCAKESLKVHEPVQQGHFSSSAAVNLVQKHADKLRIKKDAFSTISRSYEFYHKFSHSSLLALAHNISLSELGSVYIGPSFDKGKEFGFVTQMCARFWAIPAQP